MAASRICNVSVVQNAHWCVIGPSFVMISSAQSTIISCFLAGLGTVIFWPGCRQLLVREQTKWVETKSQVSSTSWVTRTLSTQHISSFSSINGAVSYSFTFKRLSSRFDIGVRFLVILGGGVSSVKVNVDVGRFDFFSLLAGLLLVSVSRRLSRSSDIGVSLLVSGGGGRSCSSVFDLCSHLPKWLLTDSSPNQTWLRSSFGIFSFGFNCVACVCFLFTCSNYVSKCIKGNATPRICSSVRWLVVWQFHHTANPLRNLHNLRWTSALAAVENMTNQPNKQQRGKQGHSKEQDWRSITWMVLFAGLRMPTAKPAMGCGLFSTSIPVCLICNLLKPFSQTLSPRGWQVLLVFSCSLIKQDCRKSRWCFALICTRRRTQDNTDLPPCSSLPLK